MSATSFVLGITRYNEPDSIWRETIEAAIASELQPMRRFVVDDGENRLGNVDGFEVLCPDHNIGCAGSWNLLCRTVFDQLRVGVAIILNGDCAVAADTFSRMMVSTCHVVAAHGFSAYRLDEQVWRHVGEFDEEYYPAYWEDADYRRRLCLAGEQIDEWPLEEVSRPSFGRATYTSGITHGWRSENSGYQGSTGKKLAWFQERWIANRDRYEAKWGGPQGSETYDKPFNLGGQQ
jgi:hypothetical protein